MSKHQLIRAFEASFRGLASAWQTERAFRLEVAVLAASIPSAFILTPDAFRRAELIACLLAVLAVELLNTSIEKLCDRTTPQIDPVIKIVKDMGSAAVFCAICMAGVLWMGATVERFS
ncbi:diacylglycerol kinase [uncultured Rhodoblastus sp.]|uniref:diacylglycerol kinase n=1 Tax=uncultured Rhodoblastus sp. TaxID=543037 RepID=UPI0025E14067|nr:diacylglycerol kinase [uncultured Rhodoblastus sp.]